MCTMRPSLSVHLSWVFHECPLCELCVTSCCSWALVAVYMSVDGIESQGDCKDWLWLQWTSCCLEADPTEWDLLQWGSGACWSTISGANCVVLCVGSVASWEGLWCLPMSLLPMSSLSHLAGATKWTELGNCLGVWRHLGVTVLWTKATCH